MGFESLNWIDGRFRAVGWTIWTPRPEKFGLSRFGPKTLKMRCKRPTRISGLEPDARARTSRILRTWVRYSKQIVRSRSSSVWTLANRSPGRNSIFREAFKIWDFRGRGDSVDQ